MKIIFVFLWMFFLLVSKTLAQNDIDFLVKNIKDSYVGYTDKTSEEIFNEFVRKTVQQYGKDTFHTLSVIADYFNDPHLKVYGRKNKEIDSSSFQGNLDNIKKYFSNVNIKKSLYEGYWINDYNNCVIALKRASEYPLKYSAYIVNTNNNTLPAGMICARMISTKGNKKFTTDYTTIMRGSKIYLTTTFRNDSIFTIEASGKWRKLKEYNSNILTSFQEYSFTASGKLLDNNNYLITIPDNSEENTRIIDSIVKVDYQTISSTKNLIIDIRNNLGGTVRTYAPLFQFVYTNPIKKISGYRYNSEAILRTEREELKDYKSELNADTARITRKEKFIKDIEMNLGKLILDEGSTVKCDSIKHNPQNVAIIANYACMSAAETGNISVSDEHPDAEKLLRAVEVASIREFIEQLPLRYRTKIGNSGNGVSAGQKQRILIARAVYKNPQYLFFDEATSALDANNEKVIMENLDRFFIGKTVVVIAHRLSTVKNADQIVVLEKGAIVEIGTHDELSKSKGRYYELVKNQLELGS
jgi:ABC-type thiamine transport system ATPase subunit